jgi:RNA polymerase sigma-70 factor (ECF subfamily)
MQAFAQPAATGSPSRLTDWERFQIEDALSRLSPRERECYTLAHGECFSYAAIAGMLFISKGSVQEYVERAQTKISSEIENSLFLRG